MKLRATRYPSIGLAVVAAVMLLAGSAYADEYNVILKDGGTPCATYYFDGDVTGDEESTFSVSSLTLRSNTGCFTAASSSTGPYTVTFDPNDPTPSRIKSIEGVGSTITLSATNPTWSATNYTPSSPSYFFYNQATVVPVPATLPLLAAGGIGVLLAARRRRRK